MPDEHSGHVRENYQWKVMLHRLSGPEGSFVGVVSGEFDQDLFLLSWGPTIAALSFVYDHADDKNIAQKAITGFRCAKTQKKIVGQNKTVFFFEDIEQNSVGIIFRCLFQR